MDRPEFFIASESDWKQYSLNVSALLSKEIVEALHGSEPFTFSKLTGLVYWSMSVGLAAMAGNDDEATELVQAALHGFQPTKGVH